MRAWLPSLKSRPASIAAESAAAAEGPTMPHHGPPLQKLSAEAKQPLDPSAPLHPVGAAHLEDGVPHDLSGADLKREGLPVLGAGGLDDLRAARQHTHAPRPVNHSSLYAMVDRGGTRARRQDAGGQHRATAPAVAKRGGLMRTSPSGDLAEKWMVTMSPSTATRGPLAASAGPVCRGGGAAVPRLPGPPVPAMALAACRAVWEPLRAPCLHLTHRPDA